jgi:hypothetical protein
MHIWYKPKCRGFDSWWCHCNFSLTYFRPHYCPWGRLSFWQKWVPIIFPWRGGKSDGCVGLTTLPPWYADCLDIWEPQTSGTLRACPGLYKDCSTFTCTVLLRTYQLKRPLWEPNGRWEDRIKKVSEKSSAVQDAHAEVKRHVLVNVSLLPPPPV